MSSYWRSEKPPVTLPSHQLTAASVSFFGRFYGTESRARDRPKRHVHPARRLFGYVFTRTGNVK